MKTEDRKKWREEETQKRVDQKAQLAEEHGVVDHPKLDKVYDLAWQHGHSAGFHEVEMYFEEFVELIQKD